MDVAKIPIGRKPPDDVNVIVEIPQGGEPVKYELDKEKAPADPPRGRFLFQIWEALQELRTSPLDRGRSTTTTIWHLDAGEQGASIPSKPWKMTPTRHNPDIGIMRRSCNSVE